MDSSNYQPIGSDHAIADSSSPFGLLKGRTFRRCLSSASVLLLFYFVVNLSLPRLRMTALRGKSVALVPFAPGNSDLERFIEEDFKRQRKPPAILYVCVREVTDKCDDGFLCLAFIALVRTNLTDTTQIKAGYKITQTGDQLAFRSVPQSTLDRVSNTTIDDAVATMTSLVHDFDKYQRHIRCEFDMPTLVKKFIEATRAERACVNTVSRICYLNLDAGTC